MLTHVICFDIGHLLSKWSLKWMVHYSNQCFRLVHQFWTISSFDKRINPKSYMNNVGATHFNEYCFHQISIQHYTCTSFSIIFTRDLGSFRYVHPLIWVHSIIIASFFWGYYHHMIIQNWSFRLRNQNSEKCQPPL